MASRALCPLLPPLALALACAACATRPSEPFEPLPGRRYQVRLSPRHDPKTPAPVLFLLHAYATSPLHAERYWNLTALAAERRWILVLPEGTRDREGQLFWNATPACCDRFGSGVDELSFLDAVWADVKRRYAVDEARVYAVGNSNGGFLAHRLACARSERFRGVVSVAGAGELEAARCQPARPVAVLQVHGDADAVVHFGGGEGVLGPGTPAYPPARAPLERWAAHNGCAEHRVEPSALDVTRADGSEATREAWAGCAAPVELWTVPGGVHNLPLSSAFPRQVFDFLERASPPPRR